MKPSDCFIVAASEIIDGSGNLEETNRLRDLIQRHGLKQHELKIAPLKMGWREPIPPHYLRGGASGIVALNLAKAALENAACDAAIISGRDFIRTEFAADKAARNRLMAAYGDDLVTVYTKLAHAFIVHHGLSPEVFKKTAALLFENYYRTWNRLHPASARPMDKWFTPVSDLFRGVDCANPSVDYEGCLVLMTTRAADTCQIPPSHRVSVMAAQTAEACADESENIPKVAAYDHLAKAVKAAEAEAGISLARAFLDGAAWLDVYTCYPVVPMAFLLKSGIAPDFDAIPALLEKHDITITGGLNLAKAPWSNTALSSTIQMTRLLRSDRSRTVGILHGNSGFGYQQGVAVLGGSMR